MSLQLAVSPRAAVVPFQSGAMQSSYASATEQLLRDTVARLSRPPAARQPAGQRHGNGRPWCALVLHLSRMPQPGPRLYHRRVARALLDDGGLAHEGQVFALRNADLVLMCRATAFRSHDHPAQPRTADSLPRVLARLLRIDLPASTEIMSLWTLPADAPLLRAYADARLAEAAVRPGTNLSAGALEAGGLPLVARPPVTHVVGDIDIAARLATTLDATMPAELLRRQTAVELPSAANGSDRLRPVHRALTLPIAPAASVILSWSAILPHDLITGCSRRCVSRMEAAVRWTPRLRCGCICRSRWAAFCPTRSPGWSRPRHPAAAPSSCH
jgi:hypothetical protein